MFCGKRIFPPVPIVNTPMITTRAITMEYFFMICPKLSEPMFSLPSMTSRCKT